MTSALRWSLAAWLLGSVVAGSPAVAQTAWDGLETLTSLAKEAEIPLLTPAALDLAQLTPRDALLIVSPESALPTNAFTTFLRDGGRVALLDDFGSGERLLSAYQVQRLTAPIDQVPALRDDPNLLVAYPASEHPLVEGVDLLLTNRASALRHRDLKPVFTFGRSEAALVLAGAVGAGRLVAVGDGSVLINQLLALPEHQRFAKNLLGYLQRPGGRLFLIAHDTSFEGTYGGSSGYGLSYVDGFLKRVTHPDLPPGVLSLLSFGLCAIAAVMVAGSLPRRSPYVRNELAPRVHAGFAGRVSLRERDAPNLVWTLLDYKRELASELTRKLSLPPSPSVATVLAALRQRGWQEPQLSELNGLLSRLEQIASATESDPKPPRIRVSELRNVVRQGEELLTRLGNG
ncbi:MAG TPA: DUF4350 domain-containing protein [Polyangiales bacterium]|nr:DUF4350 domain-containing protein [Polyangiales bacterium]